MTKPAITIDGLVAEQDRNRSYIEVTSFDGAWAKTEQQRVAANQAAIDAARMPTAFEDFAVDQTVLYADPHWFRNPGRVGELRVHEGWGVVLVHFGRLPGLEAHTSPCSGWFRWQELRIGDEAP